MSMGLCMRQELRQQLAMRLEMRMEQRLELSVRLLLKDQLLMDLEGVDDPMRVRYFEVPTEGKRKLAVVAKLHNGEEENNSMAIEEALNWEQFKDKGFEAPEMLGLLKSQDKTFLLSKFDEKAANFVSLIKDPKTLAKFIKHSKSADVSANELFEQCGVELARLHHAGIDKKDFCPRNIMVRLSGEGDITPVHTGFSELEFSSGPLSEELRNSALGDVIKKFANLDEVTKAQLAAFAEGYKRHEARLFQSEPSEAIRALRDQLLVALSGNLPDGTIDETVQVDEDREKTEETSETPLSLADRFEQIVLGMPEFDSGHGYADDYLQGIRQKWYEAVCAVLPETGVSYEKARTHKILRALYKQFAENGSAGLADIESHEDDEIRMNKCNASRLIAPVLEKYSLPNFSLLDQLLWKSLVLRAYGEMPPDCSKSEIREKLRRQYSRGLDIPERRTISKYMSMLVSEGKVSNLSPALLRRAYNYANERLETGGIVSSEACAEALQLPADQIKFVVDNCKRNYLNSAIKAGLKGEGEIDVFALSTQLDMDSESIVEAVTILDPEFGGSLMTPPEEPELLVESEPEAEAESEQAPEPVPMPAFEPEVQPEPQPELAHGPELQPAPAPTPQAQRSHQELEDRIAQLIANNAHLRDSELAEILAIDQDRVRQLLQNLKLQYAVDMHRSRVCQLIRQRPGIEDRGIMQETGLPVVAIHLALRDELLRGAIRE